VFGFVADEHVPVPVVNALRSMATTYTAHRMSTAKVPTMTTFSKPAVTTVA
jgi:hypothetical protein